VGVGVPSREVAAKLCVLMLTYSEGADEYIMTGTGTVGGGSVPLADADSPCGVPPEQKWTCEVTSADEVRANYVLHGGGEKGKTIKSFVETSACGIPDSLKCDD
jgi:hypothetical protein